MLTRLPLLLAALALSSCAVGPNYQRPDTNAPSSFRFGKKSSSGPTFGQLDWRSVFKDSALRSLIDDALTHNLDIEIAATRVVQAEANLGQVRSLFFPSIGAAYDYSYTDLSQPIQLGDIDATVIGSFEQHAAGFSLLQYEADFWGKVRRSNQAARAELLATEEAKRHVQQGVIASVATAYLTLRERDLELEIARRTLKSRQDSVNLMSKREEGGESALTDVRQAEVLVAEAEASIQLIEKQIAQLENELSYLCGRAPAAIRRGLPLSSQNLLVRAPSGLPSDMIERRPDVRASEQALIAATARVGVATAQLLPTFTLTAGGGVRASEFSDLLSNPGRIWQIGPSISVPVFTGGRLLAGLRGSKASRDEAEARYRQTILAALKDVSDSLIAYQKNGSLTSARSRVVSARQQALELVGQKYANGATSYLEVLYNDQELFGAELAHARARLDELLAVVSLYRALGGGWDSDSLPTPFPPAK